MTIGGLVAFVSLELMLIWPIDALGWIIANLQESMTAADRIYEVLDSEVTIVDRPGAIALDAGEPSRARVRFENVMFTFPDATQAGAARHRPRHPAGRDAGAGRHDRQRQVRADLTRTAALRRHRRPDHDRRPRHPRPAAGQPARPDRRGVRGADAVLDVGPGKPHARPAGRHRRAGHARRSRSRRPTSSTSCRGGSRPGSASRACRSPAASDSDSRWPGRCSAARGARARRPAVRARRAHRGTGRGGAGPRAGPAAPP